MERHELVKIYNHFVDHYNENVIIPDDEILAFANACNLKTELMHDLSIIFYAGYRVRMIEEKS